MTDKKQDVSSAEITATYRSSLPQISGDYLSGQLIGESGKAKAASFIEKYQYPLAARKIALSSAFCRESVNTLLKTGLYDSVICFASGFSLLSYYIKQDNLSLYLTIYDTDFEHMIKERNSRITTLKTDLNEDIINSIHTKPFDIEQAFKDQVNFKEAFPDCNNPIFVADGVSYFLSEACNKWLIEQASDYQHSAFIMYYWHDKMFEQSALFKRVYDDLNQGMILEKLTYLWDQTMLDFFKSKFDQVENLTLAAYEKSLDKTKSIGIELLNLNHYFPIKLLCGSN